MSDLRQFAAELIANPLVPVPPIEGVLARARHYQAARRRKQIGAGLCLVAMTMMVVARAGVGVGDRHSVRMVGEPGSEEAPSTSTSTPWLGGDATTFPTLPWSGQTFEVDWSSVREKHCPGITSDAKPLNVAASADLYGGFDTVQQLFAVVNSTGGICGRPLRLVNQTVDVYDLNTNIAVLGMPFDGHLDNAIRAGRIARAGIPVVAGDGLTEIQHSSRGVYPVGPSAAAMTRTATAYARSQGAKSFAIVYDTSHAFGLEAADSFDRSVRQSGGDVKASIGLDPRVAAYAPQADRLTSACGVDGCDFVFLALRAETAKTWLLTHPAKGRVQTAGLSTLLADDFTDHCIAHGSTSCDGLAAWSGFVPRTPAQPGNEEANYAYGRSQGNALRQGAVVAARILVNALLIAGPDATHASLHKALHGMAFRSQITPVLSWPEPTQQSQAWVLRTAGVIREAPDVERQEQSETSAYVSRPLPTTDWHPLGTGWVHDPG